VSRAARVAAAAALALACAPRQGPVVRSLTVEYVTPPPRAAEPAPAAVSPPTPTPPPARTVHVVRRGETIYRIARDHGVEPAELMRRNRLSDPRQLVVGARLIVPATTPNPNPIPNANPSPLPPPTGTPASPLRAPAAAARTPSRPPGTRVASLDPTVPEPARILAWPLRGVLYGRFGVRAGQRHDGIDIAAPEGAPVAAAADGTVIFAGDQAGYGAVVILRHDAGLVTLYAHNSRVLVHEGARVARGDAVARVGQTGRTTGPHLHFEVREGTRPRDPLLFLR
jgi:murein DD-endopeptidase MepM/ murein hydrolase activator NlpD